jgi:hypothetical protein
MMAAARATKRMIILRSSCRLSRGPKVGEGTRDPLTAGSFGGKLAITGAG